jgi:hypothetical protein
VNRREAQFWACALVVCVCAWIAVSDQALRTFFATVSGFGTGALIHFCIAWVANRRGST